MLLLLPTSDQSKPALKISEPLNRNTLRRYIQNLSLQCYKGKLSTKITHNTWLVTTLVHKHITVFRNKT